MHPYRVSIAFLGVAWGALDVEVSDPEIDPAAHMRTEIDGELVQFGAFFGSGDLQPVELVSLEYQIAQKLHAVTDPAYARAHDLVDLQLLWNAAPDLPTLRELCVRTFDWRRQQPWPPLPLRPMSGWELAYALTGCTNTGALAIIAAAFIRSSRPCVVVAMRPGFRFPLGSLKRCGGRSRSTWGPTLQARPTRRTWLPLSGCPWSTS